MNERRSSIIAAVALMAFLFAPTVYAQDDAKGLAQLRDEIAKLRDEVKDLKNLLSKTKESGPIYRGKSVSFWLDQLDDSDEKFRTDATYAIGYLVIRNKKLSQDKRIMPRMMEILNEGTINNPVVDAASWVLLNIGDAALPALTSATRDNNPINRKARIAAILTIRKFGPAAKSTIPDLIIAVKANADRELSLAATKALSSMGPAAKDAIPFLVNKLDVEFANNKIQKRGKDPLFFGEHSVIGTVIALIEIEPKILDSLPKEKLQFAGPIPGRGPNQQRLLDNGNIVGENARLLSFEEAVQQWRQAIDVLKKKYPVPE